MATIAEVWGRHELIGNLVGREIRARYKQSVLGAAWSIITPLINTLLSTFLFSFVAGLHATNTAGGRALPYVMVVYTGTMFWSFFMAGITSGADSMTANLQLLTKVYIPREVFTLSSIAARFADFGFSLAPFVLMVAYYVLSHQFSIPATILLVPFVLLIQIVLTLGLSLLLATMNLFYRDVRFMIGLLLQVWALLTPVQYPLAYITKHAGKHPLLVFLYLHLNPMTPLVLAYQSFVLGQAPPPHFWTLLAGSAVTSVALLLLGYGVFRRYEGSFAEAV